MAGARKKPAKKKMVRGPKQATMRQAPAGTREEYERRSKALAKRHGWTQTERSRWESLQRRTDREAHYLSQHDKKAARAESVARSKKVGLLSAGYLRESAARDKEVWRTGDSGRMPPYPYEKRALGQTISPTETVRRAALARQEKEGKAKRAAAKKKVTTAKKAAKKAAPKRSPTQKRAAPLKRRSYR